MASGLDVLEIGSGPPVVFIHGSVLGAGGTWRRQLELAERWTLRLPNRPGFGASPALERGDFELEAPIVAELLGDGAHLVGHSYGAVIAICAAALRPAAVFSLTVSEPGCLRVAAGSPEVDRQIAGGEELFNRASELDPRQFLLAFRGGAGVTRETPGELQGELLAGARLLMRERPPWEASPPWARLRDAPFAKLVLSGGHSQVFEQVCDETARRLGAERDTIPGRGHTIPACGAPYNERLERFLIECEARRAGAKGAGTRGG
jgi:pimeloyl-ACP methyl ester carboxylesterase